MISPGIGEARAEPLAAIYAEAELRILRRIAAAVSRGLPAPDWEVQALARAQVVRLEVLAELRAVNAEGATLIQQILATVYADGVVSAYADAAQQLDPAVLDALADATAALADEVVAGLAQTEGAMLRAVDDVFRVVVAQASGAVLAGGTGRDEVVQETMSRLARRGITSVPTARGTMTLSTYANLAVRTAVARSAVAGQERGMDRLGLDLCTLRPGPRVCGVCDPWTRKILARTGPPGRRVEEDRLTGRQIVVVVEGTLRAARAAGWGHPNCRCNIAAYIPGVTSSRATERPPFDEDGYRAQQQQRALERQIRGWKEREAVSFTPEARAQAAAGVRQAQARMRAHLARHGELKRQSGREQIGGVHSTPRG